MRPCRAWASIAEASGWWLPDDGHRATATVEAHLIQRKEQDEVNSCERIT